MKLEEGTSAPDFELTDAEGRVWRLQDLRGQKVIIFFYPADDTPGCTIEACDFRDSHEELQELGYLTLGVSPQGADSKKAFTQKYNLNFPLLIDDGAEVAQSYGVREEKEPFKGVPIIINRSTFIIDEEGLITGALYGVRARGHVSQLRERLASTGAST